MNKIIIIITVLLIGCTEPEEPTPFELGEEAQEPIGCSYMKIEYEDADC